MLKKPQFMLKSTELRALVSMLNCMRSYLKPIRSI
jgi:hypothetical protein